jgi:RNA polymerase subunit RPABC4/transcription elongation factor Spt4
MYLVGKKRCPICGVKGKTWIKDKDVFVCPNCSSFFNDFGIVLEPENKKERLFS